jgi:hypothetical protein
VARVDQFAVSAYQVAELDGEDLDARRRTCIIATDEAAGQRQYGESQSKAREEGNSHKTHSGNSFGR